MIGLEYQQSFGLFVVVGHIPDALTCLIPSTNTERYEDDPELMDGCVYYKADEVCFPRATVLVPSFWKKIFTLPYIDVRVAHKTGKFKIAGVLPLDFHDRFLRAVEHNSNLNNAEKARWRKFLNDNH